MVVLHDCDGGLDETFADLDADQIADCVDLDIDGDTISNEEDLYARLRQAELQSQYRGGTRTVEIGISSPDGTSSPVLMQLP